MTPFTLVTGNRGKLEEARRLCGFDVPAVGIDLPEVQSLDVHQVLREKANAARKHVAGPLVVEETTLELDAMNGFPGPLVRWMLESIGPVGIARTAIALGDPRATARCVLLCLDGDQRIVAEGSTAGTLVPEPRGTHGFGWDPVFAPQEGAGTAGAPQTYGELSPEDKDRIGHRGRAWRALLSKLGSTA